MFVTELVKSRKFAVVERERSTRSCRRRASPSAGDIDAKTAMQIGKLLGVNYLLTGAVTEYGNTDTNAHGPGVRQPAELRRPQAELRGGAQRPR